eukprot:scaffold229067_cov33-Tisochrysis_lutea.AAC.5
MAWRRVSMCTTSRSFASILNNSSSRWRRDWATMTAEMVEVYIPAATDADASAACLLASLWISSRLAPQPRSRPSRAASYKAIPTCSSRPPPVARRVSGSIGPRPTRGSKSARPSFGSMGRWRYSRNIAKSCSRASPAWCIRSMVSRFTLTASHLRESSRASRSSRSSETGELGDQGAVQDSRDRSHAGRALGAPVEPTRLDVQFVRAVG